MITANRSFVNPIQEIRRSRAAHRSTWSINTLICLQKRPDQALPSSPTSAQLPAANSLWLTESWANFTIYTNNTFGLWFRCLVEKRSTNITIQKSRRGVKSKSQFIGLPPITFWLWEKWLRPQTASTASTVFKNYYENNVKLVWFVDDVIKDRYKFEWPTKNVSMEPP